MLYNWIAAALVAASLTDATPPQHITTARSVGSSIWVNSVPTYVRPYAIKHLNADGCIVGQQFFRFPVTGPSSDNAFTLISTYAPGSTELGVLPHLHEVHYENFFNSRGRFQLWAENNGTEQTQIFTPGDFGAVPQNTTHTFQILDDDTEMTGVIQPGGFEKLFYTLSSKNFTGSTLTIPYDPSINASTGTPPAAVIAALESLDVYAQFQFEPSPVSINTTWHSAPNTLGSNPISPYMVAANYGPKYLNSVGGYKVIQPLVTSVQSGGNFTISTLAMGVLNGTRASYPGHAAFQVLEGNLLVTIPTKGETVSLVTGDVIFIPGGTEFVYSSPASYTKVLYISQGERGLDTALIAAGKEWGSPIWPTS